MNPEIIVTVFAEHSCSGSSGAAPIFRDIVRAYFNKYQPKAIKKSDVLKEDVLKENVLKEKVLKEKVGL